MKTKLRFLFLSTNRTYINNSIQLFPLAIATFAEIDYFGPGFQSKEVLKKGVHDFAEKNGPYDMLMTDGVIFFYKNNNPFAGSINYFEINDETAIIINALKKYFVESSYVKLLYPSIDFYNVTKNEITLLKSSNTFLLAWGPELLEYMKNCEYLQLEEFANNVNDNWAEFISEFKHKVISLPQVIAESEFQFKPIRDRKYEVSVPGANYYFRKSVIRVIKKENKFKLNKNNSGLIQTLYYNLFLKLKFRISFSLLNRVFVNTLEDSKAVVTCGSGLKYVVRKYFEIPAAGAVLVCYPCKGFEELGFVNNVNSIIINSPEEIVDVLENMQTESEYVQTIAKNGQKLVWDKHSFHARSLQLKESIEAIVENRFNGSYWYKGDYIVIK